MKCRWTFLALALVSSFVFADRTDCPAAKVDQIQIEGKKVLYRQVDAPWRTLGRLNSEDGTRERLSALLAAQLSGRSIMVGYPLNGYDCGASNYSTSANILRTHQ